MPQHWNFQGPEHHHRISTRIADGCPRLDLWFNEGGQVIDSTRPG
jgi:hypothetical protein